MHGTFNFNDSEVVICIILVLLKRADDPKVWKIYNGKIEITSFVMESLRKLTIDVKVEINVKK